MEWKFIMAYRPIIFNYEVFNAACTTRWLFGRLTFMSSLLPVGMECHTWTMHIFFYFYVEDPIIIINRAEMKWKWRTPFYDSSFAKFFTIHKNSLLLFPGREQDRLFYYHKRNLSSTQLPLVGTLLPFCNTIRIPEIHGNFNACNFVSY